jgi:transketolase
VLADAPDGRPQVLLLASGSEVALCVAAYEAVLARVSVEAASPLGWERHVGRHGTVIAMRGYGLSAPGPAVLAHFGFDVAQVLAAARHQLNLRCR